MFPQELDTILMEAIPIIHRFLRRIGSYPFQNDPGKLLTPRILSAGIFRSFDFCEFDDRNITYDSQNRLYFQSMASMPSKKPDQDKCLRDEADDEDLIHALAVIRGARRKPGAPKVRIRGPVQPPPSNFRPPWSRNMEQLVPTCEFRAFLRLMVVLNLYDTGIDAREFASYRPQTEGVTDCLLAAFRPGPNGISWDGFGQVVHEFVFPSLFIGLHRLFDPLVYKESSSQDKYPSLMEEIQTVLKTAFIPSLRDVPSLGSICTLPILSQLGIILPHELPLRGLFLELSVRHDQINPEEIKARIDKMEVLTVFLVSGNSPTGQVKFGFFHANHNLHGDLDIFANTLLFQLEPIHRVFYLPCLKTRDFSIQAHSDDNEKSESALMASVSWKRERKDHIKSTTAMIDWLALEQDAMSLVVSEDGLGRFTVQTEEHTIEERFSVDAVELLGCVHPAFVES